MSLSLRLFALLAGLFAQAVPPKPSVPLPLPEKPPAWMDGYRVRWPLRVVGEPVKQSGKTVITNLPTGGWLKPDASDLAVQTPEGESLPVTVLSHDPAGETLIQFPHKGKGWYYAYGVNAAAKAMPKAPTLQEGLTVEVREWAGDDLNDWATVRTGLQKSETVIGNAIVPDILQNTNPARPGEVRKFASSYRGFLKIDKPGVYRFFANADDAVFVFIDGFKVFERAGTNKKLVGAVPINKIGSNVELKAGIHPIEVHHVLGNNPDASGTMSLLWKTPEGKGWALVPAAAFVQAVYALPSALEEAKKAPAAVFSYGIDDTLQSGQVTAHLVRFEANGALKDTDRLAWDFGDGTTGTGRSLTHVYFKPGVYKVALTSAEGVPAFKRTVHVWAAPGITSPLSLAEAVRALAADDWKKADRQRLNEMMEFLTICERPERWKLLEAITGKLLESETDRPAKANLLALRIEALAESGRPSDAVALAEKSFAEYQKLPTQLVTLKLAAATVQHRQLKDFTEASKRYKALLDEHRRLEHPALRLAAIRWGDLFAETGDFPKATETYRLATQLGGDKFKPSSAGDATTRGALFRIAEQRLRTGDIRQTRQLLERIELEYPEQKVEGLYRFLRAEADRHGGRYEEALRNYEVLMNLTAWAGYRDRALFGIADSYARMGAEDKALKWMAGLKKSFPAYHAKQKLGEYEKTLEARLERKKNPATDDGDGSFHIAFEPGEKGGWGKTGNFVVVPSFGIRGPHVGLLDGYPAYRGYYEFVSKPLTGLRRGGSYWVEFWYRDTLALGPPTNNPHTHVWLIPEGKTAAAADQGTVYYERTLGRWRKISYSLKTPVTTNVNLSMSTRHIYGVMELDGIRVRPVSDRERDSLANFLDGAPTP